MNGQISATAGFSTNADVLGAESDSLTFTDGKKWSKKSKLSKYNMKYLLFFWIKTQKGYLLDLGIVPGFIAPDSMGSNGHELMLNRDEHYEKEMHVHPKGKKKKAEGGENTASPLKRKRIQSTSDSCEM